VLADFDACYQLAQSILKILAGVGCKKVGSYQSGGTFAGWRTLTIESSLMSGCSQG